PRRDIAKPCTQIHCLSCVRYLLFVYGKTNPQEFHSFPTRRSSDLHACSALGPMSRSIRWRISAAALLVKVTARMAWAGTPLASIDRKSTRLNSSHVKNSYAVFCLKKKKR